MEKDIRFLTCQRPTLDAEEVRAAVTRHYNLDGSYQPVSTERDQNFIVTGTQSGDLVVKISNLLERPEVIDFQLSALRYIARQNPALPVPRVFTSTNESGFVSETFSHGQTHLIHLLGYLPGTPMASAGCDVDASTRRNIGAMVADVNIALHGFFHPAAAEAHPWDMALSSRLLPFTRHLQDQSDRSLLSDVFRFAGTNVEPALSRLRHQVVHQDVHGGNLLLDSEAPASPIGLIDFGDMLFGTLAAELAVACFCAYSPKQDLLASFCDIASGYDQVLPLTEDEIDLIFDLVCIRHAMIATIVATRVATDPDVIDESDAVARHVHGLREVQAIGRSRMTNTLRKACRFPARCSASPDEASDDTGEDELIASRRRVLGVHTKHFYDKPMHFELARGAYLHGTDGHAYLDFYNNVPQVGHCHPHVVRAISRQAAALNTNTRYLYSSVVEYAERLTRRLAPHLDACIFVNSGSEANDVAWQMARFTTGNCGGLLMEDAYHGITDPIRLFSPGHPDVALPGYLKGLKVPDAYRDPGNDIAERYAADADRAISELAENGHPLAAFFVDSAFCSSGVPDIPDGYLRGVERRVRAAGGLMICDEVQSGFGRMGQWWGHEHHGVKADIVTMGKPAGNGHPLGVVVTSRDLLERFNEKTGFFSTFGGNTVACAAGNAVLDVIEREGLIENGRVVGNYLREQIRALAGTQPLIGDVRGHGLLTGVEFVTDRSQKIPATDETERLLELMRQRRVLVGKEGRFGNVLKLRPPLILARNQVDQFIGALDQSLSLIAK